MCSTIVIMEVDFKWKGKERENGLIPNDGIVSRFKI